MAISTILPTYNRAPFLSRAINSVLIQLTHNDELIIIDDGSTDDTASVVSRFGNRIRYVKTSNNGAGAARNRGVYEAKNPFITFIDSDDEWMPSKIQLQRAFMQARPDILFCFSNFAFWNKKGEEEKFSLKTWHEDRRKWTQILGEGKLYSHTCPLPSEVDDFDCYEGDLCLPSLSAHYLNINTLMVRLKEAHDALHFAEDTKTYEEWECLGRLACSGKCVYFDFETAWQHAHHGPRLTDASNLDIITARITITGRVWGQNDEFLKKYDDQYNNVLQELRRFKAGSLILSGRTKEARVELAKISDRLVPYRILAAFPGWFVKPIAKVLRKVRHIFD